MINFGAWVDFDLASTMLATPLALSYYAVICDVMPENCGNLLYSPTVHLKALSYWICSDHTARCAELLVLIRTLRIRCLETLKFSSLKLL
jgi:hypothetical protein